MKKYVKPAIQYINIITHDLCAGSVCTTIDMNVVPIKNQKHKTFVFGKGETEDMWDSKF